MNSHITISIIVPAYNEEKNIATCLTSLKNQKFDKNYEIIVINNNSTDRTAELAKSFGVTVLNESVQGVVSTRQKGFLHAKGDIVAGADADCIYPPDWLARLYRDFQKDKRIVAVGGPVNTDKDPYWAYLNYKIGFGFIYALYNITKTVLYLGAFNFAFRREVFLKLGGYNTYLDFGGDEWDPLARLKKAGKVVFDPNLKIHLSLRRYKVGFLKFWIIHAFYYYSLNYLLAKIFKRTLIHAKPVRE